MPPTSLPPSSPAVCADPGPPVPETADLLPTALPFTASGDAFPIRITRDGTWYHEGDPITRPALVHLLASVLHQDPHGDHWLITPAERGRIVVDETPFLAVEAERDAPDRAAATEPVIRLRTNLDAWITVDPHHPLFWRISPVTGEPTPCLETGNGLLARLTRPVFYTLVEWGLEQAACETGVGVGVWSGSSFFPLEPPPELSPEPLPEPPGPLSAGPPGHHSETLR